MIVAVSRPFIGRIEAIPNVPFCPLVKPEVTGSAPGVSHKFRIVRIIISACLIKQPNDTLNRMYVQTFIRIRLVAVSVYSEA